MSGCSVVFEDRHGFRMLRVLPLPLADSVVIPMLSRDYPKWYEESDPYEPAEVHRVLFRRRWVLTLDGWFNEYHQVIDEVI